MSSPQSSWALWNVTCQRFYQSSVVIELYEDEALAFCKACVFSTPAGPLSCHVWRAVRWDDEAKERAREAGQETGGEASEVGETFEWHSAETHLPPPGVTIHYVI